MSDEKAKNSFLIFPVLLAVALLTLLFSSECSPLYPINDWVDPNCFLTVGKGILEGKVPYRDLYEQKGPYVYFLHALCALISGDSFLGVWLAEIAAAFFFLWSVSKILCLYGIENLKIRAAIVALVGATVYFSFAFSTGDSVEEFALPIFSWVVYLTLKRIRSDRFRLVDYLFVGVVAGVIFWSKFTLVGFFIGWYAFFLYHTIRAKRFKEIGKSIIWIVCGVLVATLPPLFYFAVNHAVGDWLKGYLYDNLFLYRGSDNFLVCLVKGVGNLFVTLGANIHYNSFVLLGIVGFAQNRKKGGADSEEGMFLLIVPAVMALFLYMGGRSYRYYGLPLAVFSVFGYVIVAKYFEKRVREKGPLLSKVQRRVAVSGICAAVTAFCLLFMGINGNFWYIFKGKEETVQYRFAEKIAEKEEPVILNYGFLDGGFYLAANRVPEFKYFCKLNIPKPEMEEEMDRYLKDGEADFVVLKLWKHWPEELKRDNYREVMREKARYRGEMVIYVLYEKYDGASN